LLVLTLGAGALATLELLTQRREVTTEDGDGFRFGISRDGIARVVQQVCQGMKGIRDVQPRVKGNASGLHIDCVARLEPRYNPVEAAQRLRAQIKGSLESAVGIPVREVTVHMQPSRPAQRLPIGRAE
jgi:hypothetical protein